MKIFNPAIFVVISLMLLSPVHAADNRQKVDLPEMMAEHMLANMRDHLQALEEITRELSSQNYDEAAEIAENRLGMSSMNSHGASHMAKFMPAEMRAIGTAMHKAASRFALAARDAELDGGLNKAFAALSKVMQQCVACHAVYKIR